MKISNGKSLKEYLGNIFEESFRTLHSKKSILREEDSSGGGEDVDALKSGEIDTKDVIDKLNTIRAGKSFKDSAISSKMGKYVSDLSQAEKTALLAFLKGIAQIVSGEVEDQDILDPSEPPAKVKMEKTPNQVVTIKPNVIKSSSQKSEEEASGKEDTSGPAPIKAK